MADLFDHEKIVNEDIQNGVDSSTFYDSQPQKPAEWSNQPIKSLYKEKKKKNHARLIKITIVALSTLIGLIIIATIIAFFFYQPAIRLSNTLDGTILTVDGQKLTTKNQNLTLGKHNIVISKPGYIPRILNVDLKPFNRVKITTPLRPIPSAKSLVSESAFAADFTDNGSNFFYLGNNGKTLYKVAVANNKGQASIQKTAITPDVLPAISKVLFAPDFSVAVFKKTDGGTGIYDFKRYDLLNQTYTDWGKDIAGITWSPDSSQIAYYYAPANGERSIITSNKDHSQILRVFDMRTVGIDDLPNSNLAPKLYWSPDGKNIGIVADNQLLMLNVATKTMTSIAKSGISDLQFSPDSSHILYTQNNKLVWQQIETVDALKNPKDSPYVGQIKVGEAKRININAQASKSVFTNDLTKLIVLSNKGIQEVNLVNNLKIHPFYLKDNVSGVTDLGLSSDNSVLYALDGDKLLVIPLDLGKY